MGNTIDEKKLASYLEGQIPGFKGPMTLEKFAGGQSNPTFRVEAASGKYVLRRKPPGKLLKSAHAVDREFRVIKALAGTDVPVAAAHHLCEDDEVIGSAFYVMGFVDGPIYWDPSLPEFDNVGRAAMYDEMNRVLAAIHSVDLEAVGLGDFGKPGSYFERQLSRWTSQYRASETESIEAMERLIPWLAENLPPDDGRVSLVHGDYRLDNMIFSADGPSVLAVVDWELSTLGHPFADLAYQCMQWRMPNRGNMRGLAGLDRKGSGIPTEEEYIAAYAERMGIGGIPHWTFYLAFSFFRLAAITQGIKKRALDGTASSDRAHEMGSFTRPLAEAAVQIIEKES
jgi:aminoglycoside phosphotransferase (APT) family kinase protein